MEYYWRIIKRCESGNRYIIYFPFWIESCIRWCHKFNILRRSELIIGRWFNDGSVRKHQSKSNKKKKKYIVSIAVAISFTCNVLLESYNNHVMVYQAFLTYADLFYYQYLINYINNGRFLSINRWINMLEYIVSF